MTTQAGLVLSYVFGVTPDSDHLDDLAVFAQLHLDYYANVLQSVSPFLGPYEAIGRALALEDEFGALSDGKSDAQFIRDIYLLAFGQAATLAQVNHFQAQIDFFVDLYEGAGIPSASAQLQARGAVFGQIFAWAAQTEGSAFDDLAEVFFRAAANGDDVYGVAREILEPAPGELLVLQSPGREVLTGTDRQDTFRGSAKDIDASDTLIGLGHRDIAELTLDDNVEYSLNSTGVEAFYLTDAYDQEDHYIYYFSFENVADLEEIHLRDFDDGQDVDVRGIQNNVDFFFEGHGDSGFDEDVFIYFEPGVVGEGATLNTYLLDSNIDYLNVYTYGGDSFSTWNIEANGSDSDLRLDLRVDGSNSPDDETLIALHLTGDAYIALNTWNDEFTDLATIDSSGNTGGTYVSFVSSVDFTFTGGDGDDYLDIDGGFDENDSVDGGDHVDRDTLEVEPDDGQFIQSASIIGVEHLRLSVGYLTDATGGGSGDLLLVNTHGFDTLTLEGYITRDNMAPGGANLSLAGFDEIFIYQDQEGSIEVDNATPVTIAFDSEGQFNQAGDTFIAQQLYVDSLDVSGVNVVTFHVSERYDGVDLSIDTLELHHTQTLTLTGDYFGDDADVTNDGDIFIYNLVQDPNNPLQLVDASDFHGYFYIGIDNDIIGGTDFLIGDVEAALYTAVYLADDDNIESEFVFSGIENDWSVYIEGFDATGVGTDTLDLGLLGVHELSDVYVQDVGRFIHITADDGQFAGTISIEDNAQTDVASVLTRIEFDGALG